MSDQISLRALTCPNCGAPLEFPKAQASVRCRFCDSIIERSDDAPTADDLGHALNVEVLGGQMTVSRPVNANSRRFVIKMRNGQPIVIEAGEPAAAPPPVTVTTVGVGPEAGPRGRSNPAGCLVTLVILLVAGVAVFALAGTSLFAIFRADPPVSIMTQVPGLGEMLTQVPAATSRYIVNRSAVMVPAVTDAPPDVLALVTQYPLGGGDGEVRIVALSGASPRLLWASAPLDKDTYDTPLLANRDFVYAVTGSRLLALRRADGQTAWTVGLPDELALNICPGCLRLDDGRLFSLTEDGTLQALDAATGAPLWKFEAVQDSPRGLYLLAGRPAFMDRDENSDGLLRVFDPATGDQQTVQPGCATGFSNPDRPDWTTPLHVAPDEASLYLVFGFFEKCVLRLDLATLEPLWQVTLPEGLNDVDEAAPPVFTAEAVYFSGGQRVLAVAAADGAVTALVDDEDYTFRPLAAAGDRLLVRAARQRGSTRYELWAVDPASGERAWMYDLGEDPPLDQNSSIIDEDKPVWTWRVTSESLDLLRFRRAADDVSHAVLTERLDLATGVSAGQTETRLGIETIILSAPQVLGWNQDTLWMVLENSVLAFDASAGAITYRWP